MRKAVQAATRRNQRRRSDGSSSANATSGISTLQQPAEAPATAAKVLATPSQQQQQQQQQHPHHHASSSSLSGSTHSQQSSSSLGPTDGSSKRKATPDEAALTAKNYRLAKELSELRVRHREECKNVTKLTMENMNLASRCREALSHVAMLKRELAAHQRRSAEALAMQRQNAERANMAASVAAAPPPVTSPLTPTPAGTPGGSSAAAATTMEASPATTPRSNRSMEVASLATPTHNQNIPPLPSPESVTPATTPKATKMESSPSPLAANPVPPPKLLSRRGMDVAKELEILDETVISHAMKAKAATTTTTTTSSTVQSPPSPTKPAPVVQPQSAVSPLKSPPRSPPKNYEGFEEGDPQLMSGPVDSDDFEDEDFATTNQMHPPTSVDDVPGHRPSPLQTAGENLNRSTESNNSLTTPANSVSPSKTYFPQSASPKIGNYNEEYPADISAVRKRAAVRPQLGMLGGFAENEDEGSSMPITRKSSLDAFEASFKTDFPDSFSPRESDAEEKKSEVVYNPFQSPARPKPAGRETAVAENHGEPRKDPPGKTRTSSASSSSHRSMHNKVFTALSKSPRAEEGRPTVRSLSHSPREPVAPPQLKNAGRKNGVPRALNPPPLDTKQPDVRSRYSDRVVSQQQPQQPPFRKFVPFDEPRVEEQIDMPPSSPRQEQDSSPERGPPMSVKERLALFKGGGPPPSPEKESMRLNSLGGNRRHSFERSYVDEGDIPMVSNISRPKTNHDSVSSPVKPVVVMPQTSTATSSSSSAYGGASSLHSRGARIRPWEDSKDNEADRRGSVRQSVPSYTQ